MRRIKKTGNGKRAVAFTVALLTALSACSLSSFAGVVKSNARVQTGGTDISFNSAAYTSITVTVNGEDIPVRAYENITYVKHPVDTTYETMNIYIPEAYFNGGSINGFTAETAPIYFRNTVGAYMPGKALSLTSADNPLEGMIGFAGAGGNAMAVPDGTPIATMGNGSNSDKDNMELVLGQGYVLACPGARGRTNTSADGTVYTGKAPAGLVDLKAAVRYLRYNDASIPGSAERIVSDGTSAGGAMSALLGATGNNQDYEPYLQAIGAADTRDDIFASVDYCPIINLDNADTAYEWQYAGLTSVSDRGAESDLTADQLQLSEELQAMFPAYVNSLNLTAADGTPLTLDADGSGTFKDYVKSYIIAAAQKALEAGTDLADAPYLTIQDGKVTDVDFEAFNAATGRMKTPDAFDALDLSTGENGLFGTASADKQHFTQFGLDNSTVSGSALADASVIRMMNPMSYIGQSGNTVAPNFRIRYGTADSNTSEAVEALFAAKLANAGVNVDLAFPWEVGHRGDYDMDELFTWINGLAK